MNQIKESSLEESKSQMSGFISQPADSVQPPKASPASAPTGVSRGVRDKQAEDALPFSGISVPAEDSRRRWVGLGSCAILQGGYCHSRLHLDTSASFSVLWTSMVLMTQPSCRERYATYRLQHKPSGKHLSRPERCQDSPRSLLHWPHHAEEGFLLILPKGLLEPQLYKSPTDRNRTQA